MRRKETVAMPVVINEFEVVAEPPANQSTETKQPGPPAKTPAPTPHDIERILQRQARRFARVRAH